MRNGYYHPDRGYWETTKAPTDRILANYPVGTIEVPKRPSPDHVWDGGAWAISDAAVAARLSEWRKGASLTRRQFCLACLQAGLLTPDDAVTAASGGWPASFDAALVGLSAMEAAAAKVEWAAVGTIWRNAPLLAVVQATAGVTDDQLDTLFGWGG